MYLEGGLTLVRDYGALQTRALASLAKAVPCRQGVEVAEA